MFTYTSFVIAWVAAAIVIKAIVFGYILKDIEQENND